MKIKIIILFIFLLTGCGIGIGSNGGGGSNGSSVNEEDKEISVSTNYLNCVSVYTLGNVVNAVVTDKIGKIGKYDVNTSQYCFDSNISYPIKVQVLPDTFIDVDYDNKKTANDIKPKFKELKSYYDYIDLITNMHANEVENNITKTLSINASAEINESEIIKNYEYEIDDKYDINLTSPKINEKILNFIAYEYYVNNNVLPTLDDDLFIDFNNLKIFFDNNLNKPSIEDKVKYYSFFHSLELLDKKKITRVDTIHKPFVTYLHKSNLPIMDDKVIKGYYYNVIAKDIKIDDNGIYTASGVDGVAKFVDNNYPPNSSQVNTKFTLMKKIKFSDTFSNSYNLDFFSYYDNSTTKRKYLFVADGGEGVRIIDITGGSFNNLSAIMWKYYDESADKNISITIDDTKQPGALKQTDDVISVKTYISPGENKMWLAFGSKKNGLYLVDLKKILFRIQNSTYPIIIYNPNDDINNTLWIKGDKGTVYSEAFSSDGENLYDTKGKTIERYDLSSLLSISKPYTYNIQANNAYNLEMVTKNGFDELFVSTDKGVEVYDVLNNGSLVFTSKYMTEGVESGYLPKMKYIPEKNILLFTDGYKGLKAIKYDASYNPTLCGVGYFSFYGDKTKAAKVTSVATYFDSNENDYYVIVGVDGYGLLKFKFNDLLFKHCQ